MVYCVIATFILTESSMYELRLTEDIFLRV